MGKSGVGCGGLDFSFGFGDGKRSLSRRSSSLLRWARLFGGRRSLDRFGIPGGGGLEEWAKSFGLDRSAYFSLFGIRGLGDPPSSLRIFCSGGVVVGFRLWCRFSKCQTSVGRTTGGSVDLGMVSGGGFRDGALRFFTLSGGGLSDRPRADSGLGNGAPPRLCGENVGNFWMPEPLWKLSSPSDLGGSYLNGLAKFSLASAFGGRM